MKGSITYLEHSKFVDVKNMNKFDEKIRVRRLELSEWVNIVESWTGWNFLSTPTHKI